MVDEFERAAKFSCTLSGAWHSWERLRVDGCTVYSRCGRISALYKAIKILWIRRLRIALGKIAFHGIYCSADNAIVGNNSSI